MNRLFLPFSYLFYSRLSAKSEKISWVIIYVIPVLFFSAVVSSMGTLQTLGIALLAMVGYVSLYEIGYLQNDLTTTEKEKEPTNRIRAGDHDFFTRQFGKLIWIRYFYVFSVLLILIVLSWYELDLYIFQNASTLLVSRIAFVLHNRWRDRRNIITFAFLQATKYLALPLLFVSACGSVWAVATLLLIYPIVRTMEYASSEKFQFSSYQALIGSHDTFRVKYYFLLFIVSICLFFFPGSSEENRIIVVATVYFFLFRITAWLLVKKGIYQR
ncbi:hypothetical protein WCX18_11480 [Sulfurimonas sp. HSL1-2]|uniref:hypothetical protein n=1 Tax=Thiomicrolovo zhangzhouensis TaxID=3131933 RepID=UPI0031F9E77A